MDLIALARTIQADRERAIATEIRRRRLITTTDGTAPAAPAPRPITSSQRPASNGVLSR